MSLYETGVRDVPDRPTDRHTDSTSIDTQSGVGSVGRSVDVPVEWERYDSVK